MIESWFANDPGIIVLAPGTPQDAYDLLVEAAEIQNCDYVGTYWIVWIKRWFNWLGSKYQSKS